MIIHVDEPEQLDECRNALERIPGVRGWFARRLPAGIACERLRSGANEWLSLHDPRQEVPAWAEGARWVGAGALAQPMVAAGVPHAHAQAILARFSEASGPP
jgi:hypothetical protein